MTKIESGRQMVAESEKTPQLGAIVNMAKHKGKPARSPDREDMTRFREQGTD